MFNNPEIDPTLNDMRMDKVVPITDPETVNREAIIHAWSLLEASGISCFRTNRPHVGTDTNLIYWVPLSSVRRTRADPKLGFSRTSVHPIYTAHFHGDEHTTQNSTTYRFIARTLKELAFYMGVLFLHKYDLESEENIHDLMHQFSAASTVTTYPHALTHFGVSTEHFPRTRPTTPDLPTQKELSGFTAILNDVEAMSLKLFQQHFGVMKYAEIMDRLNDPAPCVSKEEANLLELANGLTYGGHAMQDVVGDSMSKAMDFSTRMWLIQYATLMKKIEGWR